MTPKRIKTFLARKHIEDLTNELIAKAHAGESMTRTVAELQRARLALKEAEAEPDTLTCRLCEAKVDPNKEHFQGFNISERVIFEPDGNTVHEDLRPDRTLYLCGLCSERLLKITELVCE